MSKLDKYKKTLNLDDYEQEVEDLFDVGKSLPKAEKAQTLRQLKKAAHLYVKKDKRISIRVYGADLERLKMIALNEGMPYQTLITSVLHKFATGQLRRKEF